MEFYNTCFVRNIKDMSWHRRPFKYLLPMVTSWHRNFLWFIKICLSRFHVLTWKRVKLNVQIFFKNRFEIICTMLLIRTKKARKQAHLLSNTRQIASAKYGSDVKLIAGALLQIDSLNNWNGVLFMSAKYWTNLTGFKTIVVMLIEFVA